MDRDLYAQFSSRSKCSYQTYRRCIKELKDSNILIHMGQDNYILNTTFIKQPELS